ncbi:MAG: helix-turn-helix transcriptional regulator, partial [Anaerolineae bacterium]
AVDRRTVYRDIDFLCAQGVPVWQGNGRFGINRTGYQANVRLTFHEATALVMAGLLLSRTVSDYDPHVAAALRKLAAIFPPNLVAHLERIISRVGEQVDGRSQLHVLETIAEGWGTGHKVKVGYRSPRSGKLRQRILAPYALEPTQSGIYIIGHDEWAEDIRTFKLDRLESATLLKKRYAIPENFDLAARLRTGWRIMAGEAQTEVALRFTAEMTARVQERRWHASEEWKDLPDGGCVLRVQVADPREMQPWIRSWGAAVEVLAPDWLRAQIGEEMRQAAANYAGVTR